MIKLRLAVIVTALSAACTQGNAPPANQAPPPATTAPATTAPPPGTGPGTTADNPPAAAPNSAAPASPNAPPAPAPPPAPPSTPVQAERAAPAAPPSRPAAPTFRELTIPAGTTLSVKLTTPIASDTSKVEDPVRGTLSRSVVVSGATALPAGSEVVGSVLDAKESGRVKGKASVAFRFNRMVVGDERHEIRTARIAREAASSRNSDVKKGAIGAAVGGVVGGIVGGAKGAVIGAGAGGTGAVVATKGNEVRLGAGTIVTTTLQEAMTVRVPIER
jgi:hypothetical protein